MRTHTCGALGASNVDIKVTLVGWVNRKRDHGGLSFIDIRDRFGITQIVVHPEQEQPASMNSRIKPEYVIKVTGTVKKRPPEMVNPDMATGEIEVYAENLNILNPSITPPFVIEEEIKASEELRLKYRFLDLRRRNMLHHFQIRHSTIQSLREFLSGKGFIEVETPLLAKSTPEGARDFLVPSRLEKGKFYALAQSPQIYKQILMVAGFDRYYQFAKCLRDEDLRGNRQPEHTQIDIEMSFVNEEDIFSLTEMMMKKLFFDLLGIEIKIPFPRIQFPESIRKYGTDKPDTRIPIEICDYTEVAKMGNFNVFNESNCIKGIKLQQSFSRKRIDELGKVAEKLGAPGLLWLQKRNTYRGPFTKYFTDIQVFDLQDGETLFLLAGEKEMVLTILGNLRKELGKKFTKQRDFSFIWVTHFPLFEWNQDENNLIPSHHIFTMPVKTDMEKLENEPEKVRGRQYDLVINGTEIASGSIRNHNARLQRKLFGILGLTDEDIDKRFGFLLNALDYGAPPHGGIAPGIDRLCMIIENLDNIRDVIAFPKTLTGKGLFEGTPSKVEGKQLSELGIEIRKDEKRT